MQRRVVIDGYNLALEQGTGVATYARNLSYECNHLGYSTEILYGNNSSMLMHPLLREIALFDSAGVPTPSWIRQLRAIRQSLGLFGIRASKVPVSGSVISRSFSARLPYSDVIWNAPDVYISGHRVHKVQKRIAKVHGLGSPDIVHWTYPLPLKAPGARNVYTLHDLVPLRLPFTTLDNKRRYLKLNRQLVKSADHIITVSETSRNDIINLLGCKPERVTNTYQAVSIPAKYADKTPDVVAREIKGAFDLEAGQYFMFFGAIEPKKNVARLIEAYLASGVKTPLLIVGKKAWKSEEELKFMNAADVKYLEQIGSLTYERSRIKLVDYAPFNLLVSAIKGAKAVLFPSLYEGFGLPVLESMLLGTPVMTSAGGATGEVAGDAALLVDPYDTQQMANAIIELDTNAELRASLAQKGPGQAALYSSERYRARISEVYDNVCKSSLLGR